MTHDPNQEEEILARLKYLILEHMPEPGILQTRIPALQLARRMKSLTPPNAWKSRLLPSSCRLIKGSFSDRMNTISGKATAW